MINRGGPRRPTTLLAALVVVLAGCGPSLTHTPPGEPATGNLTVVARQNLDGPTYFEGSLRYVRVARIPGPSRAWETLEGQETTISVPAGQYTVSAWERVCGGNCDAPGPITNRCSISLEIPVDGTARIDISWTVPNPCVMTWAIGIS